MCDDKERMKYDELFELYKHFDDSVHKKETLFLGVSFAMVPAVFVSWDKLSLLALSLAAIASIVFYWLHGLHINRYAYTQDKIRNELVGLRSNFNQVFDVPESYSIRKLRLKFRYAFVVFWILVILARCYQISS